MKKEAITHGVLEDLANRNDNWDKLDGVPEKVTELEESRLILKNEIVNGDFSDGTTRWSVGGGMVANVNNIKSTAQYGRYNNNSPTWEIGSKYYLYTKIDIKQATNGLRIVISGVNGVANSIIYTYQQGLGIQYGSTVFTINNFFDDRAKVIGIIDYATSNWAEADIGYLSVINLTQTFGAGNEPTKEEMDIIMETIGYFNGTHTITSKEQFNILLKMVRENTLATTSLGGGF